MLRFQLILTEKDSFMKLSTCAFLLLASFITTGFTGCSEEPKTKQWFKDNPDELNKVYTECQKTGDESVNCRNAKAAHQDIQQKNAPVPKYSY